MIEQSQVAGDQPLEESTDQATPEDQVNDQAEEAVTPSTVHIDGEDVPLDKVKDWKLGYMREDDYRRKTQELAEERRQLSRASEAPAQAEEKDPDLEKAIATLKQAGMVTKDDLALIKAQEDDQKQFRRLLKANPELKVHEKKLLAIGKVDNRAWEDIVDDYGFIPKDKLQKAKASRPLVGKKEVPGTTKQKSVSDMTSAEYTAWKKQNLGDGLTSL